RREDVHLVLEEVGLQRVDELLRPAYDILLPVHQLAQPGDFGIELGVLANALLISPVRGYAVLRDPMHLAGADLDLERFAVEAENGSVERLVEALLWARDVVVELAWQRVPQLVNDAQGLIALGNAFYQ